MLKRSHRRFNLRREALDQLEELALKIGSQTFSHEQSVESLHELERRQGGRSALVRRVDVEEELTVEIGNRSPELCEISIEHGFRVIERIAAAALEILEEGVKSVDKIVNTVESALRKRDVRFREQAHVSKF